MFILAGFLSFRALAVALALLSTVLAAPLPMDNGNEELMEKMKLEVTGIKSEMGLNEESLNLLRIRLNIFPLPLEQCKSDSFSQDACYTELLNGLKSMDSLLSSVYLYETHDLSDLLFDLREFISNMKEAMVKQGIPIPAHVPVTLPRDISEFHEKAGIFLILHDLCNAMSVFQEGLAAQRQ